MIPTILFVSPELVEQFKTERTSLAHRISPEVKRNLNHMSSPGCFHGDQNMNIVDDTTYITRLLHTLYNFLWLPTMAQQCITQSSVRSIHSVPQILLPDVMVGFDDLEVSLPPLSVCARAREVLELVLDGV